VDSCEIDPALAWDVNVNGAENLAKVGTVVDADIVQLSSNYVFDGRRSNGSHYSNDDSPNPINFYGKTKLAGERAVSASNPRAFIVRTSWVFGPYKQNFFSLVPRLLRNRQRIRAITDVFASSSYANDLVTRTLEIVSLGRPGTYHVVNSELCSYYEFALEAGRILGMSDVDLEQLIAPACLADFQFRAERPKYTPLSCRASAELGLAPMRDWRSALTEYIHGTDGLLQ
jgi:dTDP-4-dehydrorhamnose reductase